MSTGFEAPRALPGDLGPVRAQIEKMLVGVDGSPNGQRALEWAILLGGRFEAELVVVHVVGLLDHLESGRGMPRHSHVAEIRDAFETRWCAPLSKAGVRHRDLLLDGSAVPVLLEVADREAVDVIVLGSRGTSVTGEFLLGRTSHQVAEQAGRPVLVVPPGR